MIQMESLVQVADNTGARSAKMIGVIGKRTRQAHIGDIITCHIREKKFMKIVSLAPEVL